MLNILIAGCGDLGTGLAQRLVEAGHDVSAIRRTGTVFPDGVNGITGDLLTLANNKLPDVDVIFLIMTPLTRTEEGYRAAYLHTAKRLIDRYHSSLNQPKVFFISSTSVYGQSKGEWVTESQNSNPTSATAKVLLETEQILNSKLPTTSIRFSGIYGANRFRLIEKIIAKEEWGENQWTNRIHRNDCVDILAFLLHCHYQGIVLESLYIATDDAPVSMWEVKLWIATTLNVSPNFGANIQVSDFVPAKGKRLSNQALKKLGFCFQYPSYISGYTELIDAYHSLHDA